MCFQPGMRDSTASPIFLDFKSDILRVVRFLTAGQGNEDPGYEVVSPPASVRAAGARSLRPCKKRHCHDLVSHENQSKRN